MNNQFYCQNCGKEYCAIYDSVIRFGSKLASHDPRCYGCKVRLKVYRPWFANIIDKLYKKYVLEEEYK